MKPINLIQSTSAANSNYAIDKTDTESQSLTTDSKEKLLRQWNIWAGLADPGKGEKREMALLRLIECLETDGETLALEKLNLTSLPDNLPPSIKFLHVNHNQLTSFPENLPPSLKELDIRHNELTTLSENIPDSIEKLNVSRNKLTVLPHHLPGSLKNLIVFQNQLHFLPETFPARLELLAVGGNRLTTLPENLPRSLNELHAQKNALTILPNNLPESLVVLCVNNNRLTDLPKNLSGALQELDVSNNQLLTLPEIAFNQDTFVSCQGNPAIDREVGILFGLLEACQLWTSQKIDKDALKTIIKEDNLTVFSNFLTQLHDLKNSRSEQLRSIVSSWLGELFKGENADLRKQTFAVARLVTESCVDRASYYFNQMYSLMIAHRLIKNSVSVEETFQTLRGLFRLQELEKISAIKVQAVKQRTEEFSEDIEIYLAYQYLLREKLALPIHTELQYVGIACLSEEELEAAKVQIIEIEKQDFLRFLVNDSEIWREKIKSWNDTKLESADNQILEEIDNMISEVSASNSYDVSIKTKTDELRYKVYLPLTQEFLKAHGKMRLLDEFTSR